MQVSLAASPRAREREEFPISPDCTIFEILLLPDGHGTLERVDGEAASVKGSGAVRRADRDKYAGFADLEAPEPVNHRDTMDAVFFVNLHADFAHFREGHGFIGFVVEVQSGAVVGLIADEA